MVDLYEDYWNGDYCSQVVVVQCGRCYSSIIYMLCVQHRHRVARDWGASAIFIAFITSSDAELEAIT